MNAWSDHNLLSLTNANGSSWPRMRSRAGCQANLWISLPSRMGYLRSAGRVFQSPNQFSTRISALPMPRSPRTNISAQFWNTSKPNKTKPRQKNAAQASKLRAISRLENATMAGIQSWLNGPRNELRLPHHMLLNDDARMAGQGCDK
jgi:hypothetical protein